MKKILERLFHHEKLTEEEAHDLLIRITRKEIDAAQTAVLLAVHRMRGVTAEELLGYRRALAEQALPTGLTGCQAIDIVGTGGDGKDTFNISTCACFVVAGVGGLVCKHGNYAASSVSGASTVLQQHGIRFTTDSSRLRRSMEESGVAYLHAPLFHPALAAVGPLRRAFGLKTVFNLLGPLVNPAQPAFQMLGVADLPQMRLYTQVLRQLGRSFTIVNSLDGYDEISLTGTFKVVTGEYEKLYRPADIGLAAAVPAELAGGDSAEEAARRFDAILQGRGTAAQEGCVAANAAFALHTLRPGTPLTDCVAAARESIRSGKAWEKFRRFIEINSMP